MASTSGTGSTGEGQALDLRQPFGTTNYVIATEGVYPSRSLSTDPLLGSVAMFAGNFAPSGWAFCNGQLLPISGNESLFSILGTTYGGDGQTSFALPDLRGRVPIGIGDGPGLEPIRLGQQLGSETTTLPSTPAHSHSAGSFTTGITGSSTTLETTMPSLGLMPVVATNGLFPSRSLSSDPGLGDIAWFAGNFAPRGWAQASGQLLAISENQALFALFGTFFGGDGRTTFALPDLRGRIAIGTGRGAGLTPVQIGQRGGSLTATLSVEDLPTHNHSQPGSDEATGSSGASASINLQQPWLALNHVVGMQGSYPPRNLDGSDSTIATQTSSELEVLQETTQISDPKADQALKPLIKASQTIWKRLGASPEQLNRLKTASVQFADLDSGSLAEVASDQEIRLDRDARGRGWFFDPTPLNSSEFSEKDPYTGARAANQGPASRHYDLLTTLLHEQAHLLGKNHLDQPNDLMHGSLSIGIRKQPRRQHLVPDHSTEADHHTSNHALIGDDTYIAAIQLSGYNFAPLGAATASGSLLSISENTALFSLLGSTYGGDGRTTFGLPDFRGRAAIGSQGNSQGPGLSPYFLGTRGGLESIRLSTAQIPSHNHSEPSLSDITGNDSLLPTDQNQTLDQPANADGTFTINGKLTNSSTLIVNGQIINNGSLTNNDEIINNGTINTINGAFTNNGTLSGSGIIEGSIIDNGTLKPGNSAGGIFFDGHFVKGKGALKIELSGHRDKTMNRDETHHDFLEIKDDAQLGGRLKVKLIDDYILKPGKKHKIIKIDGERIGTFKNYNEGDRINAKNHAGQNLFISYAGGNGNDVVLYTKDNISPDNVLITNTN